MTTSREAAQWRLTSDPSFTPSELGRYSRQMLLPQWGLQGQKKVKQAKVVIIGMGGLGCPAARYLAASGIGHLHLVDDDLVSASNLHRQVLYYPEDVGKPKVHAAALRLSQQFPDVKVSTTMSRACGASLPSLLAGAAVVVDGTDNFASRYLINDACVAAKVPLCHASIGRFSGQASVFAPGGPCYRCLFPEPPPKGAVPNCDVAGVIGVLPGTMAIIQATEALKLITGIGKSLQGTLLLYDSLQMSFQSFALKADPECSGCHGKAAADADQQPAPQPVEVEQQPLTQLTPTELAALPADTVQLLDVREPAERQIIALEPCTSIPLAQLFAQQRHPQLQREGRIVVLCKSGLRAQAAAEQLTLWGYSDVAVLAGGLSAYHLWQTSTPLPY